MDSNDTKREPRTKAGETVTMVLFVVLVLGFVGVMIYGLVDVFGDLGDFGGAVVEYAEHQKAQDGITAGTVIRKEIISSHTVSTGGGIVAGTQGSGVIIGGNKVHVPTQYRLYVGAEYVVDGQIYAAEKYFEVPVEVYMECEAGDFFDSQSFHVSETSGAQEG